MKKWKKLTALLLAMVMVLGLAGTAIAAEEDGYTDVPDWAKEYVDAVTEKGLIDGKTVSTFAPDEQATRVDLVVALYRLAKPAAVGAAENPFTDLDGLTDEQKTAITWAYSEKIINGTTPTTFEPNGSILRQELAKLLNGFAAWTVKASALTSSEDMLGSFPDASSVESWAKDAMNWAVASEFINGSDGGRLDPNGTATRAEVAVILCRYMDDASTGDASKDKSRNEDGIGENELLVVSFGTSYNDNRAATIGAIENALEKAFPEYSVRRGFTANIIIEHVFRRDGQVIDDVEEALDRAVKNGVKNLLVQPTHLMNGYEYGDLREILEKKYADKFETIRIGAPLLTSDADYAAVAEAMVSATASFDDGKTAICYMGHGTEAASNGVYDRMQKVLTDGGHTNYFVGTVEAHPDVEDVLKMVQAGEYTRVVLRPMMIVAGDHANNDMAGDEDDSWKTVFENAGYEVVTEIKGLGEIEGIQQVLVEHAKAADLLSETTIEKEPNPETAGQETSGTLADGTYTIEVTSDAKMFRVIACELTVADGKMTAKMALSGVGYDQMYVGTKAEAENAAEGLIDYVVEAVEGEDKYTFTVPVEALDTQLAYAAHASESGKWFDRGLTFVSATAEAK